MNTAKIIPVLALSLSLALVSSSQAETKVTLNGVHLCCKSCVTGVEKAVSKVQGASVVADKDARTVTITAPDDQTAQQAVNFVQVAGYYGTTSATNIRLRDASKMKDQKVQSLEVKGVHLCCQKCVDAVNKALADVSDVKGNTAEKGAEAFTVTGDFNAKDVFVALNKAGLSGRGPGAGKGKKK